MALPPVKNLLPIVFALALAVVCCRGSLLSSSVLKRCKFAYENVNANRVVKLLKTATLASVAGNPPAAKLLLLL